MKTAAATRPFTIAVEGNIGAGKSTFLEHFAKFKVVETVVEPVEKWRNMEGHNLLALQYQDPERWCHLMQSYVQLTMAQNHCKPLSAGKEVKMMERSLHSSRHCFIQNLHDTGKMRESEFHTLVEWYEFLSAESGGLARQNLDIGVDMYVYLRTSPAVAYERVKARARKEEEIVPLEYLTQLHQLHDRWLLRSDLPTPVLVVDADQDIGEVPDIYSRHEAKLLGSRTGPRKVLGDLQSRENAGTVPC